MTLYDKGLFKLDDDISYYLGYQVRNPSFPTIPITFRMILSHTSSIRDGSPAYDNFLSYSYNVSKGVDLPNIKELITPGG